MIVVDSREDSQHPDFAEKLRATISDVSVAALPAGDFLVGGPGGRILIERKDVYDLSQSLASKRIFEQIMTLKDVEDVSGIRLLVEGSIEAVFWFKDWNPIALFAEMVAIEEAWDIPIFWSPHSLFSLEYVKQIHKRLNPADAVEGGPISRTISVKKRAKDENDQKRLVLQSIRGIGGVAAHRLLTEFGSVIGVAEADEEDLMVVEKIGRAKAETIIEALSGTYKV